MRFRDTNQRVLVCKILFDLMGLGDRLWCPEGPTENLEKWLRRYGGGLSTSQTALYEVALGIWNGSGRMPFTQMLRSFEEEHLKALGSLLVALASGHERVDEWIDVWAKPAEAVV